MQYNHWPGQPAGCALSYSSSTPQPASLPLPNATQTLARATSGECKPPTPPLLSQHHCISPTQHSPLARSTSGLCTPSPPPPTPQPASLPLPTAIQSLARATSGLCTFLLLIHSSASITASPQCNTDTGQGNERVVQASYSSASTMPSPNATQPTGQIDQRAVHSSYSSTSTTASHNAT